MTKKSTWIDDNFRLLEEAAAAGARCPQSQPHGPIRRDAIRMLVAAKRIRSAVYRHNYRVVTILVGPHAGKTTAPAPRGFKPYRINGVHVDRFRKEGEHVNHT